MGYDFIGHFKTITHHRHTVMKECFKVGLYKQGLLHDLSKYSLTEFMVGARYYQGHRSPNIAEKEDKGYSSAWLHHKGRNKHHYEYWIDYGLNPDLGLIGNKMPDRYVVEMFLDRMAACKIYQKEKYTDESPLIYYTKHKGYYVMHNDTRALLEKLLTYLAENGEKATYEYIKNEILR